MARILEIYDIEVLVNCFTYTGYVPSEDKYYQFVIWRDKNDLTELCNHLMRGIYMVGFNNEKYDYPVLHHIINHYNEYVSLMPSDLTSKIYKKSQEVIDMEFSAIADKNKFIPQLDLFKMWHYDNKGRACSLKHLECSMRMDNIEDMPFHHTHYVKSDEELNLILGYNKHDVHATHEFYKITIGDTDHTLYKGKNKIQLRKNIKQKYKIPCFNYPDVKLGEQLLLTLYCAYTGNSPYEVKQWRSPRNSIKISDCIFPYIKFKTKPFQVLKDWLSKRVITTTKGAFSELPISEVTELLPYIDKTLISGKGIDKKLKNVNIMVQGNPIIYGTGGLHHSRSGKYEANDEMTILDIDVGSLYPSIAVQNDLYPEHLGPIFSKIYNDNIVAVRLAEKEKPKKERDPVIMEGLKLAANGSYGKSNEESSFLYDPLYTMRTTINGQLLLTMLIENILLNTDALLLQGNTDGATFYIARSQLDTCLKICSDWEKATKLMLEYSYYKMMAIVDVSTYLAVYENGDIKHKSDFEIDKELHKNPSMRIVPIALEKYFVENIPVEKTIKEHTDIYDFCLMTRCPKKFDLYYYHVSNGKIVKDKLSKTTRYFASNRGGTLFKLNNETDALTGILVGQHVTLFNKYYEVPIEQYDIDYDFYINECNKIIEKIEPKQEQLTLF